MANEEASGAFGATVVSQRAVTTGITALPDPVTEDEADFWFLYKPWAFVFKTTSSGFYTATAMGFDSRAQRKVEEGDDIAFVIANASSSAGCQFQVMLRMLIKLH